MEARFSTCKFHGWNGQTEKFDQHPKVQKEGHNHWIWYHYKQWIGIHFLHLRMNKTNEVDSLLSEVSPFKECCHIFSDWHHSAKRTKSTHFTPEIIVEIEDRTGKLVPIRTLVDTGTTSTILLQNFIKKGRAHSYKNPIRTIWATMGGIFMTNCKL